MTAAHARDGGWRPAPFLTPRKHAPAPGIGRLEVLLVADPLDQHHGCRSRRFGLAEDDSTRPVDRPSDQTVKVRQGTGPRAMVSVLLGSLLIAAIAGTFLLLYFYFTSPASPP